MSQPAAQPQLQPPPSPPPSLAPSQIFVCRHGSRLDASDSAWHLTSPTPYDPPLTYGGWTQARSLGNRIASHIVSHISSEYPAASLPTPKPVEKAGTWTAAPKEAKKEKKDVPAPIVPSISSPAASKLGNTKIIIHTSPFLRCVQTSIAVTAGMSQYFSDIKVLQSSTSTSTPAATKDSSDVYTSSKLTVHPRPMLRIDGWLGEWLCEDYFAEITPPPASSLMIGTAKIDLMRPSSAGGLRNDGAPVASTTTTTTTNHTLPTPHHSHHRAHSVGFVPPVANSAIGKNEPIPRGHVSHAKDFLDIDYAYDSLRYGDGGEYGEEWGRMHKRVKIGFEKIVKGYADGEVKPCIKSSSTTLSTTTSFTQLATAVAEECSITDEKKGDIPGGTVVIFISHGAICNALIGAMTHKPVLMDMGIASMSMGVLIPPALSSTPNMSAVTPTFQLPSFGSITSPVEDIAEDPFGLSITSEEKKNATAYSPPALLSSPSSSITTTTTTSVVSTGIPNYDVRIMASTDHLRSQTSQVKSPSASASSSSHQGPGSSSSSNTPPLRPRKQSLGGGFSMYNTIGKIPAPLIGSANTGPSSNNNNNSSTMGGGNFGGGGGNTGLFTGGGRAMGMVFGSNSGGLGGGLNPLGGSTGTGPAMGVRRTASAAAATKGLWSLSPAAEMERGSSDEGAVLTDEESGEDKDKDKEKEKNKSSSKDGRGGVGGQRKGSTAGSATGGSSAGLKPGLWNAGGGAGGAGGGADRRRRWTVTNQNEDGGV
ncbi:hypothetical protein AA313_de0203830 [Arthrobotrys entomopaga]|nr:hypothetical protein AA313_de0203830 [Arthrobotrys entomopaga]